MNSIEKNNIGFKGIRENNIKELTVAIGIAKKNDNRPSQIVDS